MEVQVPSEYTIHSADGESYATPLAGTIHSTTVLLSVQISLVQTISLNLVSPAKPKRKYLLRKDKPLVSPSPSSFVQEIVCLNLSPSSTAFALSLPVDLPPSIHTPSSNISYEIIVSATTSNDTLIHRQPLLISRLSVLDPWEDITHFRSFLESPVKAEYALRPSQKQTPSKCFSGQLLLRNIAWSGPRSSEVTLVVVESLRWQVDQVEEWTIPHSDTRYRWVRTLASDNQKRRWRAIDPSSPLGSEEDVAKMTIAIPYQIEIDNGLADFSSTSDRPDHQLQIPGLTIRHELTVEILTGTETVNRNFGCLVARRNSCRGFGAKMALPLHEFADREAILTHFEPSSWMPPGYDHGSDNNPPLPAYDDSVVGSGTPRTR